MIGSVQARTLKLEKLLLPTYTFAASAGGDSEVHRSAVGAQVRLRLYLIPSPASTDCLCSSLALQVENQGSTDPPESHRRC